jgi:hypothetical protein
MGQRELHRRNNFFEVCGLRIRLGFGKTLASVEFDLKIDLILKIELDLGHRD